MEKNIILKEVVITPTTKKRIEKKVDKLKKFFDKIATVDVLLEKDNSRYIAEIRTHLGHKTITAKKEAYNLAVAIDDVYKKIKREISEYKSRIRKK
ncbi:ribosomal subunit interface protein [candidate division WOR-3 bacterium JGI_Cruoil_03_44_89]|uniref:Ribosomal subunit interface protein n=1 Tax=candidate division WOR-3 bacterium JGI_Cruoil_03_44_89 TaxID=1973748 RepID=A0A235BQZ3_UNCW3|nr:MAG: ribosomal subunit interface protein [candidate division WOR-3 bacterium JGI_Cruoil_03_44_89]